jgi:hypothetical protein
MNLVAKHTPGPWKAQMIDGRMGVTANHMCSFPGMRYDICERVGGDCTAKPTKGTPEANARLIAAAPELLEALQRVVSDWVHPYDGGEYEDGEMPALDQARAAIAKATGGAE